MPATAFTLFSQIARPLWSAIEEAGGLGGAKLVVLCDVHTPFEAAAKVFGPQKGAGEAMVRKLTARLRETHGMCGEHGDVATTSLIEVWIDEAERRTWFLFEASRRSS